MSFDFTISLGALLQLAGLLVTAVVLYAKLVARFVKIETIVETLWPQYEKKLAELALRVDQVDHDARNRDEGLSRRFFLGEHP